MKNIKSIERSQTIKADRLLKESKTIHESNRNTTKSKISEDFKQSLAVDPTKYGFNIDPFSLENIMSNYNDRVLYNNNNIIKQYPDLYFFEKQDGIQTLIN